MLFQVQYSSLAIHYNRQYAFLRVGGLLLGLIDFVSQFFLLYLDRPFKRSIMISDHMTGTDRLITGI